MPNNDQRMLELLTQLQRPKQNVFDRLGGAAQGFGAGLLGQVVQPKPVTSEASDLLGKLLLQKQIEQMFPSASEEVAQISLENQRRLKAEQGGNITQPNIATGRQAQTPTTQSPMSALTGADATVGEMTQPEIQPDALTSTPPPMSAPSITSQFNFELPEPEYETRVGKNGLLETVETENSKAKRDLLTDLQKKTLETLNKSKSELSQSATIGIGNLFKIAGVGYDLSSLLAKAQEESVDLPLLGEVEGGGGAIQAFTSRALTKFGDLPLGLSKTLGIDELGGRFANAGAVEGKREELLLPMIPMLTQQGTKPGSVRIIRSVLEALGKTIPDLNTATATGIRQMEESLKTFYRYARAAYDSGLTLPTDDISDRDLDVWINNVIQRMDTIEISETERQVLDLISNKVTMPLQEKLKLRRNEEGQLTDVESFNMEDVAYSLKSHNEASNLPSGTVYRIGNEVFEKE